jgi:hypothetical protein
MSGRLTGRDTSNRVRCSKLASPRGGVERETGRGPEAVVGHQARLTVWSISSPRPHHGVGHTVIPDRSMELHRAVSACLSSLDQKEVESREIYILSKSRVNISEAPFDRRQT